MVITVKKKNNISHNTIIQPSGEEIKDYLDVDAHELLQEAQLKILTDEEIDKFINSRN